MPIRFQVDADFYDHPKVLGLSDAAVALWTRAGSYSAAKLTNGFIAEHVLATLSKTPEQAAEELRSRGLWKRSRGGYQFHQWEQRNLTKERVQADQEADRARKKAKRNAERAASKDARKSEGTTPDPQVNANNVRPESERNPSGIQPESERIPASSVSVSVSESVSGSGRGARPSPTGGPDPHTRPPDTCPEHQDDPDPPACRRCRTARERAEAWDADYAVSHAMTNAHAKDTRPQCPTHPGQLAHNCGLCRSERIAAEPTVAPAFQPPIYPDPKPADDIIRR